MVPNQKTAVTKMFQIANRNQSANYGLSQDTDANTLINHFSETGVK